MRLLHALLALWHGWRARRLSAAYRLHMDARERHLTRARQIAGRTAHG